MITMQRGVARRMGWMVFAGLAVGAGAGSARGQSCMNWFLGPPPSSRMGSAMAYDSARGVTVLFGGRSGTYPYTYNSDTWEWNGTRWTQRSPATSPSPRQEHALAYDSGRGVTVLLGGFATNAGGDTWEWNGTNWTQCSPAMSPSARAGHAMAYDSARAVTVRFGGNLNTSPANNGDTWEWNGTTWTQRSPATSPSPRFEHAMVYDSMRGVTVLYGGNTGTLPNGDTWELGSYRYGDLNCDGAINFDDIDPFVLALTDPAGYHAAYPNCDYLLADINGDGAVTFDDIDPFVVLLSQ
jgi:hypothetical protein